MTIPVLIPSLNGGEISPQMWGRSDLDKFKKGLSTCRNMFASYRGAILSRAGTAFVGQCKQSASDYPPQLIPFQFSADQGIVIEAGNDYMRFVVNGGYATEAAFNITGITQANPGVFTIPGHDFSTGDWVAISGVNGMIQVNGQAFSVGATSSTQVEFFSTLTSIQLSTAAFSPYTSGGQAARIFTLITPYQSPYLQAIKWTQSADVMTLCHPLYAPQDLERITDSNWSLAPTTFGAGIASPASISVATSETTASNVFYYQYVATAVDVTTGEESIPSPVGTTPSVDIATQAGTLTIACGTVPSASSYNFYRGPVTFVASPSTSNYPQAGAVFGYVGSSFGPTFTDTNITPDFTISPPTHTDPFAIFSIISGNMTNNGSSYNPSTTTVSVTSLTGGTGFKGFPIIESGFIEWLVVQNGGQNYSTTDTVNFVDSSGGGSGAAATLVVGPGTGTYPSVAAYFQQRRFYADSNNNPDTYWASKPGSYTNFDSSLPTSDSDAITGTPWSQQVNGIQWMINMPGGLVVLTGLGAWQLSGGGGGLSVTSAITPSNEVATPQAFNGVSPLVRPLPINYDILYVQEKGSIVRDLAYNVITNIYTGTDMTVLSNHLFDGHTIERWDWAEEPNKLLWAVRDDGILLCLTYLKEQDVYAWTRHDTNGLFQSVACVSEPPVNAPYFVVKRLIQGDTGANWAYYLERMDNRLWTDIENTWCVDCGMSYAQNEPGATLTVSSAAGVPTLQNPVVIFGGANYSPGTIAFLTDPTGTGALLALVIAGGVITAVTLSGNLTGYTAPQIVIADPTGAGGGFQGYINIAGIATVTASGGVFANVAGSGAAGDVIRSGGGIMTVTQYNTETVLTVAITRPIAAVVLNDPYNTVVPQTAGNWTIINPTTVVNGLFYLEGMTVSCLADGVIQAPQVVKNGQITLPEAASSIIVGLGFTAQAQTMYIDVPSQVTSQGRRKTAFDVVVRVQNTPGPFEIGANQPDASIQPSGQTIPWQNMSLRSPPFPNQAPLEPFNMFTGDIPGQVNDQLGGSNGQIAFQQRFPVPLNILSVVPSYELGDDPG